MSCMLALRLKAMLFGPAHSAPCVKQLHGVSRQRSGQSLSSVGMATYAVGTLLVMEVLEEVDRGAAGMLLFLEMQCN